MNVSGKEVAKALAPLRRDMLRGFKADCDPHDEILIWYSEVYPRVLRQLRKVRGFKSLREADAYMCGYIRGLRDAVRSNLKRGRKLVRRTSSQA